MKEILSSLEALFLEFNIRRLFFWLFLIILTAAALFVWEGTTGYFFYGGLERRVFLLKELHSLAQDGITQNSELSPIYYGIATELTSHKTLYVPQVSGLQGVWKFVSGASIGIIMTIIGIAERKNNTKWKSTVLGGLSFGIILGILGNLLPTFYNPWVNYLGYPIVQLVAILGISKVLKKRKVIQSQQALSVSKPLKT